MFLGGALIDIFGKKKMLFIYLLSMAILFAGFSFLDGHWENKQIISGFIIIYFTLRTFIAISIFAIAMQLCWKQVAATQFTLYMYVMLLVFIIASD